MTKNDQMFFSPIILERCELERNDERHRAPLVKTLQNLYDDLTPKGQGQNLTSGQVGSRSSWVKTGKKAYHSKRIDELITMRPRSSLYLCSVRSVKKRRDLM